MSKQYNYEIYGHPSMLSPKERKLKVYFDEPENSVNEDTGILLLIAGFGGNANSNIYKKMRREISDRYNLLVVQCDYFGWEFMQKSNNIFTDIEKLELEKHLNKKEIKYIYKDDNIFERFIEVCSKNKINISAKEKLNETLENYNDMGLIQAIDNISAVLSLIEIIKDNGYNFNKDKIIMYGHSHGAYLSYLCNALEPNIFSLLIDNSSWLFPQYIDNSRYLYNIYGDCKISIEFDYLAKTLEYDREIINLPDLYKKFDNKCDIICYHGTNDNLISNKDKKRLKYIIDNFYYNEINYNKVDNKIFKSTGHGLGADFLELFNGVMKNYKFKNRTKKTDKVDIISYETEKNKYLIDYRNIIPQIRIQQKVT